MSDTVTLSSFELRAPLAEGGMGLVYRAVHRETEVPVAVKVSPRAAETQSVRRFRKEVQAHAGLHHPDIVHLFEYGTVGEEPAGGLDDRISAGSPYVAMEYAEHGALRDRMPISGWETMHSLLVQILDGLAHAHARDVIHRDLKPENLLVFESSGDSTPVSVKLADFGIAHVLEAETAEGGERLTSRVGTLSYMAPEQLRGRWRQYGPWTDLYALGCVAWELACGRPPIVGEDRQVVAVRHESVPRPPLEPQFPVPDGLERWIRRAMAIEPEHRFRRAADAAWALPDRNALSEGGSGDANRSSESESTYDAALETRAPTLSQTDMFGGGGTTRGATLSPTDEVSGPPTPEEVDAEDLEGPPPTSPIPDSWRRRRPEPLSSLLVGTGLGLFGLRETPFVDRDAERNEIWEALGEVDRTGEPSVVVVVGGPGAGKSRLVEWMARRTHELGAARVMRAVHTAGGDPAEGLPAMVRRLVRGQRLERGAFHEHLLAHLPALEDDPVGRETDARALTELVEPTADGAESVDGPRYRFGSPGQKAALVARTIRRFGQRRRPFVWLDDIHWGTLAARVVSHLLESPFASPPALVATTLRADILAETPSLQERLEGWMSHDRCTRIDLAALEADDHRRYVDRMLPLADELAERVAERTEGNPLFASQLLQNLVEGHRLETAADGFAVPAGESLELPGDVHELWMRRLQRWSEDLAAGDPEPLWRAVERAAALGREVDGIEWGEVCRTLEIEQPDRVRTSLVERGLADRTDNGWAFAHGLLVDSLEQHAREQGRWEAHHRRCVDLLEELYPDQPEQTAGRRAEHWIEAGELEEALAPLREEFERHRRSRDLERETRVLERSESLFENLGISSHDPRVIENDIRLVLAKSDLGAPPDEQLKALEDLRRRAASAESDRLLAKAWRATSLCRHNVNDHEGAREAARRAVRHARRSGAPTALIMTLLHWSEMAWWYGELDVARERSSEAYELAVENGDLYRELRTRRQMAWVALSRGDDVRARKLFDECLGESSDAGHRGIQMECLNGLGELARYDGDVEEAQRRYRQIGDLARELNAPKMLAVSTFNLALVALVGGQFEAAAERLREADRRLEKLSLADARIDARRLAYLTGAAGVGDWDQFDELYSTYSEGWPEESRLEKDHPWLLEMAGDYAAESGENERATTVWRLARTLWEEMGDEQAADRIADKLDP